MKSQYYDDACTAHNKDGLKINDFLAVRDALTATQHKFKATELLSRDDIMVQAGFQAQGENAKGDRLDELLQNPYFQGFLPRYRGVSAEVGIDFEKAKQRNRALDWHASVDSLRERAKYDVEVDVDSD